MGLFRRKKAKAAPADPLALMAEGFLPALGSCLAPPPAKISVAIAEHDACRAWLSSRETACLSLHSSSSRPWAGFFLEPGSLAAKGEEGLAALEGFGRAWSASLKGARAASSAFAAKAAPGNPNAALWPFLELEAFRLDLGGREAWFLAEPSFRAELAARAELAEGKNEDGVARTAAEFAIPRSQDFPVLDAFLPRAFASGKYRFSGVCSSFGFLPGAQALEKLRAAGETSWYFAGFELPGAAGAPARKLSMVYAFDSGSMKSKSGEQEGGKVADALAVSAFHQALMEYAALAKCQPANPGIKRIPAPPDLSKVSALLYAKSVAIGAAFRMPFAFAAPAGALMPLLQAWVSPEAQKRGQSDPASLILRLNSGILAARLGGMLSPPELRKKAPRMLVSELLNHVSDGDYDLVLQNCLIASMGAKELPALFYYTESVTGEDGVVRERVAALGPLDSNRLFAHMPESFRDDYVLNSGKLHANPASLCLSRNAQAMAEIAKAARSGRISASPRLSWLIKEFFLKPARAEDEAELAVLKAKGLPFAALAAVNQRLAQRAMARVDDRDAALAVLDSTERLAELKPYISKARMERLGEELSFLKRQYESGEAEPSDLIRAKKLVARACEEVKLAEAKEAQAALEREKARQAAPPPPAKKRGRR